MLTKSDLKSIGLLLKIQKEEMVEEVDKKLDKKFEIHTKEILKGIAEYIQENLIPLFDDHESRISKLERHTSHPPIGA
jgi:hypothetical protein